MGILLAVAFMTASCGEKADQASELLSNMKSIAESAGDMADKAEQAQEKQKERTKSGDTLSMPTDQLMKYLPASISGYEAQEPEYETVEWQGMTWTKVSRTYVGDKGKVEVALVDYNGSPIRWMSASVLFSMKFKTENKRELKGTFETDNENVNGYEELNKESGRTSLSYGIGGRFMLTINAENQKSTSWAKDLAEGMNLDALASR